MVGSGSIQQTMICLSKIIIHALRVWVLIDGCIRFLQIAADPCVDLLQGSHTVLPVSVAMMTG